MQIMYYMLWKITSMRAIRAVKLHYRCLRSQGINMFLKIKIMVITKSFEIRLLNFQQKKNCVSKGIRIIYKFYIILEKNNPQNRYCRNHVVKFASSGKLC